MNYFWIFLIFSLFLGCSQKNPELKTVVEHIKVYDGEPIYTEDRFGVDAKDNTTVNEKYVSKSTHLCKIHFRFNRYNIDEKEKWCIDKNAEFLKQSSKSVVLEGNCDEVGSSNYNYKLGLKRANSVKNALLMRGIKPNQIRVVSFGKNRPVCLDNSKKCHGKNRRVEFIVSKK